MKQPTLIIILLFTLLEQIYTQTDTGTVYKNLEAKKYYSVNYGTSTDEKNTNCVIQIFVPFVQNLCVLCG